MIAKLFKPGKGHIGNVEVPSGTTAVVIQGESTYAGVYTVGMGGALADYYYWRKTHYTDYTNISLP